MSKQKMFQIIGIQWQVSEHCTGILAFEIVVKMIKTKSPQIIPQRNRFSSQRSRVSLSDSDRKNPSDSGQKNWLLMTETPFSCSICHEDIAKLNSLGGHVETVHVLKKMLGQIVSNLVKST